MTAWRDRLGPPPSWSAIVKATLSCSLIGVLAAIGVAASAPDPTSVVVIPGAVTAATMLFRRRFPAWAVIVSIMLAGILSGPLWLAFNSAHATRWALVADAGLCPIAGVAVARLLEFMNPEIMITSQPAEGVHEKESVQRPGTAMGSPTRDPVAPPLPADLIQPPQ